MPTSFLPFEQQPCSAPPKLRTGGLPLWQGRETDPARSVAGAKGVSLSVASKQQSCMTQPVERNRLIPPDLSGRVYKMGSLAPCRCRSRAAAAAPGAALGRFEPPGIDGYRRPAGLIQGDRLYFACKAAPEISSFGASRKSQPLPSGFCRRGAGEPGRPSTRAQEPAIRRGDLRDPLSVDSPVLTEKGAACGVAAAAGQSGEDAADGFPLAPHPEEPPQGGVSKGGERRGPSRSDGNVRGHIRRSPTPVSRVAPPLLDPLPGGERKGCARRRASPDCPGLRRAGRLRLSPTLLIFPPSPPLAA
jgi:hypothetical protein